MRKQVLPVVRSLVEFPHVSRASEEVLKRFQIPFQYSNYGVYYNLSSAWSLRKDDLETLSVL